MAGAKISINGTPLDECRRETIVEAFKKMVDERDQLVLTNKAINILVGQQLAELQIIKSEIKAIYDYRNELKKWN